MLEAAERACRFCAGKTREDLDRDEMLFFAVLKSIEVVGEASAKVRDETRRRLPAIEWKGIRQMRNRTVHGYDTVSREVVWRTIREDLPPLIEELRRALAAWPLE